MTNPATPPEVPKPPRAKRRPSLPREVLVAYDNEANVSSDDPMYLVVTTDEEKLAPVVAGISRQIGVYRLVETRVVRKA